MSRIGLTHHALTGTHLVTTFSPQMTTGRDSTLHRVATTSITRENRMAERGFVWLDSSLANHPRSTQSLAAECPCGEIVMTSSGIRCFGAAEQYDIATGTLYGLLDSIYRAGSHVAVGCISYEAMLSQLGMKAPVHSHIPLAHFFLYESFHDASTMSPLEHGISKSYRQSQIVSAMAHHEYIAACDWIKDHIREGDIYQANLTSRFDIQSHVNPIDAYLTLRRISPAPHAAFLHFGDYCVLSSSPERLFRLDGSRITTNPIKGTIRRHTRANDNQAAQELLSSEKNLAELLMIVDLERNDLGRIAETGTVTVKALHRPEIYAGLIHLVAEVSATVRPDATLSDILRSLLPGGSITGAPKLRAIDILQSVEQVPRSIYTGAIGYVDGNNRLAEFNIAIRTMIYYDGVYEIHAGGGIVADSKPDDEYDEMLLKASRMLSSLGIDPERVKS